MWWRKSRKTEMRGDPAGVAEARRERERSEAALRRDREQVIKPLQRELYKNNIQELVEELLRPRRGNDGPRTNAN